MKFENVGFIFMALSIGLMIWTLCGSDWCVMYHSTAL